MISENWTDEAKELFDVAVRLAKYDKDELLFLLAEKRKVKSKHVIDAMDEIMEKHENQ